MGGIVMKRILTEHGATRQPRRGSVHAIGSPLTHTGRVETAAGVSIDRDEGLVEALRLREPTAAERLIARYGDRAYRLAVRITGNAADAEEVVQDTILKVVRKIDTFRGDCAFGSWFYRVVSNAAYGRRRRPQASIEIPLAE